MKEWTRSDTIVLAYTDCSVCHGAGIRIGRRGGLHPCNCVLRGIFRACYNRFRYCVEKERHIPPTTLERGPGGNGNQHRRYLWSRKEEEYVADFQLVSRRSLSVTDWNIFRFHFLLGADWKMCCRRLNIDRGTFFHAIYRIERQLGRVFRELEPYALYPLDEYFGVVVRKEIEDDCIAGMHCDSDDHNDGIDDVQPPPKEKPVKRVVPIRAPLKRKPETGKPDSKAA
jgi:hypothetical protein